MRRPSGAFLVVAALGARAESMTSTPFDGTQAPWAQASRQLFLGADSPPPPSLCTDACVFASTEDNWDDCNEDGAPGSEFPMCACCTDCVDCCPRCCPRVPTPPPPPAGPFSGTGSPDAEFPNGQFGTDCADYGPGQPPAASPAPLRAGTGICTKTCFYDADCDDGGPVSEFPMRAYDNDCDGRTASLPPPPHSPGMVRTNNCHNAGGSSRNDGGGPVSECLFCAKRAVVSFNRAVLGIKRAVASTSSAGMVNIRALMGNMRTVMGNMRVVVSSQRAVVGIEHAVMGTMRAIVGSSRAVMGIIRAVSSSYRAVVGIVRAVMGNLRAVVSTTRVVLSTVHVVMGTPKHVIMGTLRAVASTSHVGMGTVRAGNISAGVSFMHVVVIINSAVMGTTRAVASIVRAEASTSSAGMGTIHTVIGGRASGHIGSLLRLREGTPDEIALEELFDAGTIGDADIKYSFPYDQTDSMEDPGSDEKGGLPLRWVECLDGALVLLRLGLLVFAVCSEPEQQERSGANMCFAIRARHNRSYRNKWRFVIRARQNRSYGHKWFKLALLALLIPRVSAMETRTKTPPDGDGTGTGAHRAKSGVHTPPLRPPPLTPLCTDDLDSGAFDSDGAPMPCSYFSAQPSACASYSVARTNCPVACDTCSPLLQRLSHTRPPPSPPPLMPPTTSSLYPPNSGWTWPRASSPPPSLPLLLLPLPTPPPPVWLPSSPPQWSPLMALPCTELPCIEASDAPGLNRGLQLAVPSHRRELQTAVSTSAALTSALANTAVSRIVLASGTYNLIAELNITRSVILEAATGATVTLNAQPSYSSPRRVLTINPGPSGVVQLIGLGITGGYVSNYVSNGGGVFVNGGTVTLSSCTISGNSANNGGGVYVQGGTVSIVNSQLYSNGATNGGGVFVNGGTVTLSSCTISGNTAINGGGVAVFGGTVAISSCTISGNTVQVHAHVRKFPEWENALMTPSISILIFLMGAASNYQYGYQYGDVRAAETFKSSHRPDGIIADGVRAAETLKVPIASCDTHVLLVVCRE
eukprot:jgi/Chrpa1/17908/Chrysochromulina_OHIO_Genome00022144-RA